MDELKEYANKGDMSAGDLDIVDKLIHSTKNLCKVIKSEEEEQNYKASGNYGNMPYSSNFYQNNPANNMMNGGMYGTDGRNRTNNGRYSGNGTMANMANMIRSSMSELPHGVQREAGAFLAKLEDNM